MKTHEAADLFPLLEGAELQALVDSMKRHGFDSTKPIVRCNGWIIDGRNRLRAAEIAGVEPVFVDISESTDPWMEAWKHNGARRDLDPDRKGAIFLEVIDSSEAWKKEQERRRNAANKARSEAAKGNQNARKSLPPAGDFSPERKAAIALDRTERGRQGKESRAPRGASPNQGKSAAALATQAGVSTRTIERAQKLKREAPERHLAVVRGETRAHAELRQLKHQERTKKLAEIAKGNTELATGRRYPVIYADPPWRYEHVKTESRAIENQYPTMDLDSICALPVAANVATEDAVLFLWATSPKLAEAMRVVEAWGFTYRTCMVWVKDKIGMGYYARQQHELLLIATRGTPPVPEPKNRPNSVVREPRTKHSAKPERFYDLIEAMYPGLPWLEMFCRTPRKGWAVWGNQS